MCVGPLPRPPPPLAPSRVPCFLHPKSSAPLPMLLINKRFDYVRSRQTILPNASAVVPSTPTITRPSRPPLYSLAVQGDPGSESMVRARIHFFFCDCGDLGQQTRLQQLIFCLECVFMICRLRQLILRIVQRNEVPWRRRHHLPARRPQVQCLSSRRQAFCTAFCLQK